MLVQGDLRVRKLPPSAAAAATCALWFECVSVWSASDAGRRGGLALAVLAPAACYCPQTLRRCGRVAACLPGFEPAFSRPGHPACPDLPASQRVSVLSPCPVLPQVYAAPLAGGGRAVVLLNAASGGAANITVSSQQLGLPAGTAALVRDLFAERDLGEFRGAFSAAVPSHDVAVLKLTPVDSSNGSAVADDGWRPWHQLHAQLPPRRPQYDIKLMLLAGGSTAAIILLGVAALAVAVRRQRPAGSGWRRLGDSAAAGTVQLGPAVFVGPAVQIGRSGKPEEEV